jgi:hypothetical protein
MSVFPEEGRPRRVKVFGKVEPQDYPFGGEFSVTYGDEAQVAGEAAKGGKLPVLSGGPS